MRRHLAVAGAAVAAALVLSGCGSSGGDKDKGAPKGGETQSGSPSAAPSGSPTGPTGSTSPTGSTVPTGGAASAMSGAWLATTDGKRVVLAIEQGKAALSSPHACAGEVTEMGGTMLMLKCADGNTDRISGKATLGAGGRTLTVSWDGGIKDIFVKATGA